MGQIRERSATRDKTAGAVQARSSRNITDRDSESSRRQYRRSGSWAVRAGPLADKCVKRHSEPKRRSDAEWWGHRETSSLHQSSWLRSICRQCGGLQTDSTYRHLEGQELQEIEHFCVCQLCRTGLIQPRSRVAYHMHIDILRRYPYGGPSSCTSKKYA